MSYKVGLVGLPNVGKSSLFKFLTKKNIKDIANYPFATIKPNIGIITLADSRLDKLSRTWQSPSIPSALEIIDIAGLIRGAAQGSGLGNEFLSHIREVDLICQVLRCFPEKEIIHVEKSVDPLRDYEIIQLELILADLQQVEKKLAKLKARDEKSQREKEFLRFIQVNLEKGISLNQLNLTTEEKETIKVYNFLTIKPSFLLFNYSGDETEIKQIAKYAQEKQLNFFPLAVKLESQIQTLSLIEKKELDLETTNLTPLAKNIKELLKLKTFFTVGEDEVKSWLVHQSANAKECAGLIHSDIQKGFIQVEVYNYNDWETNFSENRPLREIKGRREGARYIVEEGDVCYFVFRKV